MSIEKLSCCLAHPMNALRALKDKINEVITGHNKLASAVENLPAGTGSGGSSGPCGLVLTINEETGSLSHTAQEAADAYNQGGYVSLNLMGIVLPLTQVIYGDDGAVQYVVFTGILEGNPGSLYYSPSGEIIEMPSESPFILVSMDITSKNLAEGDENSAKLAAEHGRQVYFNTESSVNPKLVALSYYDNTGLYFIEPPLAENETTLTIYKVKGSNYTIYTKQLT